MPNRNIAAETVPTGMTLRTLVRAALGCVLVTVAYVVIGLGAYYAMKPEPLVFGAYFAAGSTLHGLFCLGVLIAVLRWEGISAKEVGIVRPTHRLWHLLWQVPCGIAAIVSVQIFFHWLTDRGKDTGGGTLEMLMDASPLLIFVGVIGIGVCTPIWEELFFRGMLLSVLQQRFGSWVAVLGSAALFGAFHVIPALFPYLFTLGIVLALLRLFHRNLWASMIMHMTINLAASSSVLFALSS